jgi:hypothetical protein
VDVICPVLFPGLPLHELSAAQEALVVRLLGLVYSERGLADFRGVMAAEIIVRGLADPMEVAEVGGWAGSTVGDRYYLRVLGDPAGPEPWAWRLKRSPPGAARHARRRRHLVQPHSSSVRTPAEVLTGPQAGRRFLAAEQDLGFQLLHALEPAQLSVALVSDAAPDDILTRTTRSPTRPCCTAGSRTAT